MTLLNQLDQAEPQSAAFGSVSATWLGQAGFLIRFEDQAILIDAYLSDSLAKKYQGKLFPHTRLLPAPLTFEHLPVISAYLMTHGHTDHMDPETIAGVSKLMRTKYVFPKHELNKALERGVPGDQAEPVNAGDESQFNRFSIIAVPAAHEEIQVDEYGYYHALGYVIKLPNLTIYHSGDCVPFTGQSEMLSKFQIDFALLPINGRDKHRLKNGVPGNFHAHEALELCEKAKIPNLIPHHFGLFEFNTVNPMDYTALFESSKVNVMIPEHGQTLELSSRFAK